MFFSQLVTPKNISQRVPQGLFVIALLFFLVALFYLAASSGKQPGTPSLGHVPTNPNSPPVESPAYAEWLKKFEENIVAETLNKEHPRPTLKDYAAANAQVGILFLLFGLAVGQIYKFRPKEPEGNNVDLEEKKVETWTDFLNRYWAQLIWLSIGALGIIFFHLFYIPRIVEYYKWMEVFEKIVEAIFIAAFVSMVFDLAYHESAFGRFIKRVVTLLSSAMDMMGRFSQEFDSLEQNLNRVDSKLNALSNFFGYLDFRADVLESYTKAHHRIISVSDYWSIEEDWWKSALGPNNAPNEQSWKDTLLFRNLSEALQKGNGADAHFLSATFAGEVPWPACEDQGAGQNLKVSFDGYQFRRFLGVLWRLVIAHEIRRYYRSEPLPGLIHPDRAYNAIVPVRVLTTSIPISATIVDDDVWVLFPGTRQDDVYETHGVRLTPAAPKTQADKDAHKKLSDAYAELMWRYLRHAHSAREYVQSILTLIVDAVQELDETKHLKPQPGDPDLFEFCLDKLGLREWAEWEVKEREKYASGPQAKQYAQLTAEQFQMCAKIIARRFRDTLWMAGSIADPRKTETRGQSYEQYQVHDLVEDLF